MKIFIDFDDTVFDTAQFKAKLKNLLFKFNITQEEFEATYLDYPQRENKKLKFYNPENQIKKLEKLKKKSLEKARKKMNLFMRNLSQFVFNDFYFFAQEFSFAELFLVSFGDSEFQKRKIIACGVKKYFKRIFITKNSKGKIIRKQIGKFSSKKEQVFFVDDRIDQLIEVRKENPKIILIRMKRPEGRFSNLKESVLFKKNFFEGRNFFEVEKIIEKISSRSQNG